MDPKMIYAEVKNKPLETLIYEYERVTEGEAGIRVWKRKATQTKTKAFRNWIRRSYVPISELNAVDAAKRRQGAKLLRKKHAISQTGVALEISEEQ
jgi:hypothetical protein